MCSRSASEIYRHPVGGVVKITALDLGGKWAASADGDSGSGFVVSADGTILTNAHVISPGSAPAARVDVMFRTGDSSERRLDGAVLCADASTDLAVVRVDPEAVDFTVLRLGDSRTLALGDPVFSIGNALDYDFGMTKGIVSGLHRVLLGLSQTSIWPFHRRFSLVFTRRALDTMAVPDRRIFAFQRRTLFVCTGVYLAGDGAPADPRRREGPAMATMTWVGLDVHARSIEAAAVDARSGELAHRRFSGESGPVVAWCGPIRCAHLTGRPPYQSCRKRSAINC